MKRVVALNAELSVEERNLLSVGYKNVIGSRRASWRIVNNIEQKAARSGERRRLSLIQEYRREIEAELQAICRDILQLLEERLIPSASAGEAHVFYRKMKGDYHRYLAEFVSDELRQQAVEQSLNAYRQAAEIAKAQLTPTHAIRLGLALNFSVFYYEILNSPERACRLARAAFEDAVAELHSVNDDSYKDSTLIMQLLRDNLTLWTADIQDEKSGTGAVQDLEQDS